MLVWLVSLLFCLRTLRLCLKDSMVALLCLISFFHEFRVDFFVFSFCDYGGSSGISMLIVVSILVMLPYKVIAKSRVC